jgi:hypothetical protein
METVTDDGVMIVSSDPTPESPPDETPAAPVPETGPSADSASAAPSEDDDDRPVSPRELRRIVGRFTRQRSDLEAQLGTVRAQNETLMRMLQPPAPPPAVEPQGPPQPPDIPNQLDFDSDEAYRTAQRRYRDEQARYLDDMVTYRLNERDGHQRRERHAQAQQQTEAELDEVIRTRERELIATVAPDYLERFSEIGPQLGDTLIWGLKQAGVLGPDLVLHLHAHQDEIARLRQIPPSRIGIELGKVLGTAGVQQPSPAQPRARTAPTAPLGLPEPPQLVSGGGGSALPGYSDTMTQQQFDEWSKRMYPTMPYQQRR